MMRYEHNMPGVQNVRMMPPGKVAKHLQSNIQAREAPDRKNHSSQQLMHKYFHSVKAPDKHVFAGRSVLPGNFQ